jgi:antitoxin HicB
MSGHMPARVIFAKGFKGTLSMSLYKIPMVLEPQPEGGYTITCPLIPGLITEADTFEDVIPNVTDAVAALIEGHEALNRPLPAGLQMVSS